MDKEAKKKINPSGKWTIVESIGKGPLHEATFEYPKYDELVLTIDVNGKYEVQYYNAKGWSGKGNKHKVAGWIRIEDLPKFNLYEFFKQLDDVLTVTKAKLRDELSKYGCKSEEELSDKLWYEYGVYLKVLDDKYNEEEEESLENTSWE